jgi:hypothetical protein
MPQAPTADLAPPVASAQQKQQQTERPKYGKRRWPAVSAAFAVAANARLLEPVLVIERLRPAGRPTKPSR